MSLPVTPMTRAQMNPYIAIYDAVPGSDGGYPDSRIPGGEKVVKNLVGYLKPEDEAYISPAGADARPVIVQAAGFGLGIVECKPGNGAEMHNHDTTETFVPIDGKWRIEWIGPNGPEHVDLGPCDVISFPAGVPRRFVALEAAEGRADGRLLAVVEGNQPAAEYTPDAIARMVAAGALPAAALHAAE